MTDPEGLFLGLDVGTQGTKALVADVRAGRVVARAAASYDLIPGLPDGAAEQHPDTWWSAVSTVLSTLAREVDLRAVVALGVSGQQHGFVALDEEDRVLRPAKLWCDTSTASEARELSESFKSSVPTGFTAPKILWMKRREPELYERLRHVLLPHDWINFRLTGEKTMEAGDASGTGLFDPVERRFDEARVSTIDSGLGACLPPLLEAGQVAGRLTPEAAKTLGLTPGIPIASGGGDNMLSAIGSGATRPGVFVLSLGTSGTVFAHSAFPVVDPAGAIAPFCDSTGGWLPLLCVMNVTGVTEEVRAVFGDVQDLAHLTAEAAGVEPGSEGLLLLPYLQGERVPDLPDARGSLLGIRHGNLRPATLFRAAIEGTSLNLSFGVDRMRALGMEVTGLRLVGGGSKNPLWRQVLADVLQTPVQLLEEPESAALGGALQACWTVQRLQDPRASIDELTAGFVRPSGATVEPDPRRSARYRELASAYREAAEKLYGAS